jgi:hypothetical protein
VPPTSETELSLAERDLIVVIAKAKGWNLRPIPGAHDSTAAVPDLAVQQLSQPVTFLRADDRQLWRGLLVLPVQPCTKKTQAIGQ